MTDKEYFPILKQTGYSDCGPTCLAMLFKYYKIDYSAEVFRTDPMDAVGLVSLQSLSETAQKYGFITTAAKLTVQDLSEINLPCLLHWKKRHYVVLYRIEFDRYYIADPARGLKNYTQKQFGRRWLSVNAPYVGIVLLLAINAN